jgi:DNA-binding transcriptional ArsR family regulator
MNTVRTCIASPRLELFFALAAVLGDEAPVPQSDSARRWLDQARRRLDQGFRRRLGDRAKIPAFWRGLAALDLPRAAALTPDVETVIEAVAALPADRFGSGPDSETMHRLIVDALRRFDRLAFAAYWRPWRDELTADLSRLEARLAGVPINSSPRINAAISLPSRFAPPGFVATADDGQTVLLAFDPDRLPMLPALARRPRTAAATSPDAALIFRALGDATRYTIARMIAREPLTSAELARRLDIAKPTMAHHLRALRAAGLVIEETRGTRIVLTLDRTMLEALSEAAVAQLFGASSSPPILRSRRSAG